MTPLPSLLFSASLLLVIFGHLGGVCSLRSRAVPSVVPAWAPGCARRSARGAAILELAITAPLLLTFFIFVFKLYVVYADFSTFISAARIAASVGASSFDSDDTDEATIVRIRETFSKVLREGGGKPPSFSLEISTEDIQLACTPRADATYGVHLYRIEAKPSPSAVPGLFVLLPPVVLRAFSARSGWSDCGDTL